MVVSNRKMIIFLKKALNASMYHVCFMVHRNVSAESLYLFITNKLFTMIFRIRNFISIVKPTKYFKTPIFFLIFYYEFGYSLHNFYSYLFLVKCSKILKSKKKKKSFYFTPSQFTLNITTYFGLIFMCKTYL